MKMTPVQSSQVAAIGYAPDTKKLRVRFKPFASKGQEAKAEPTYEYANVSQGDYDAIFNAESIGREINQRLKKNPSAFPYRKLSDEEAAK